MEAHTIKWKIMLRKIIVQRYLIIEKKKQLDQK